MSHRADSDLSLSDILRNAGRSSEGNALEDLLRRSSNELLNSAFPPDVRRRYSRIGSEQRKTIEALARDIRQTLTSADVSERVLSGMVAEKVKEGIADILSGTDYAAGVGSIG